MRPSAAVSTLLFAVCLVAGVATSAFLRISDTNPIVSAAPVVAGLLAGAFLAASVKVVAQWERMIILRLGKFTTVAEPGPRLLIPVIDTAVFVEMRVQTVPIAQQQ